MAKPCSSAIPTTSAVKRTKYVQRSEHRDLRYAAFNHGYFRRPTVVAYVYIVSYLWCKRRSIRVHFHQCRGIRSVAGRGWYGQCSRTRHSCRASRVESASRWSATSKASDVTLRSADSVEWQLRYADWYSGNRSLIRRWSISCSLTTRSKIGSAGGGALAANDNDAFLVQISIFDALNIYHIVHWCSQEDDVWRKSGFSLPRKQLNHVND